MLTKIKRIRRKNMLLVMKLESLQNIPTGSQPQQGGLGTRKKT